MEAYGTQTLGSRLPHSAQSTAQGPMNHSRDPILRLANSQVIRKILYFWTSQIRSVLIVLRRNPEQLVENSYAARLLLFDVENDGRARNSLRLQWASYQPLQSYQVREHNSPTISNILAGVAHETAERMEQNC
jgi:hypothetical protein